jgi:AcrR family transcriptional regulator
MPSGTASNYFPSREALLVATARRIVELHHADMDRTARHHHADTAAPAAREASPTDWRPC